MLVVNAEGPEIRVAVVEEGSLAEFFVERKRDRGIVGNIYRGKVSRVLPGMQAAFVDLGPKVNASPSKGLEGVYDLPYETPSMHE